jgi:hypothetical protein
MKILKIVAFATLAIFLFACDSAVQSTPSGDTADEMEQTQVLQEEPHP